MSPLAATDCTPPVPPSDAAADHDLLAAFLEDRALPDFGRAAAAALIDAFGGLAGVAAADAAALKRAGLPSAAVGNLGRIRALALTMARAEACQRPVLSSWSALTAYVQVAPADAAALRPLVRLLFYAAAQALTGEEKCDAVGRSKRHTLLMVMDEFPLLGRLAFFEKSLRLMSGYGIKAMFVAQSLNDIVETYGQHNTILDNCHVYTAFSALDPLTQDKVSKLTGSVTETRTSRSAPTMFGGGRSSVSRSEIERPLMEPGEIRALPDDQQLVFVAGQRPLRTEKLLYDRREPFRSRANGSPPDQALRVDSPGRPPHPWLGRRSLGRDTTASLPLFKEVAGAMDDRKAASRAADIYGRVAQEMAAQQAVLDQLQGGKDA